MSITPLQLDLTNYKAMDRLKKWKWDVGGFAGEAVHAEYAELHRKADEHAAPAFPCHESLHGLDVEDRPWKDDQFMAGGDAAESW